MKEKKTVIIRHTILFLAVLIFCYSGYQIISTLMEYQKGEEEYQQLQALIFQQEETKSTVKLEENFTMQTETQAINSSDIITEQTEEEQKKETSSHIDFETLAS